MSCASGTETWEKDRAAYCASRTVTQVRAKIEAMYANTFAPSCSRASTTPA